MNYERVFVFMENKMCALILAGGEGTRMKSNRPKVLAEVLFKPLIHWVTDAVKNAGIDDICVVTGSKREFVEEYLKTLPYPVETVFQPERLGTGHAVMIAKSFLEAHKGQKIIILGGDAPFISSDVIKAAFEAGKDTACTVITAEVDEPKGYGRIVRDKDGISLKAIAEEKEADDETKKIKEINSGAYCFDADTLTESLGKLTKSAKTGEYYLTDTIEIIKNSGKSVIAYKAENSDVVLGANDRVQLAQLNEKARMKVLEMHMRNGVSIPCTDGVIIGTDVKIGANTVILPATVIRGKSIIGSFCEIGPAALIDGRIIEDGINTK